MINIGANSKNGLAPNRGWCKTPAPEDRQQSFQANPQPNFSTFFCLGISLWSLIRLNFYDEIQQRVKKLPSPFNRSLYVLILLALLI